MVALSHFLMRLVFQLLVTSKCDNKSHFGVSWRKGNDIKIPGAYYLVYFLILLRLVSLYKIKVGAQTKKKNGKQRKRYSACFITPFVLFLVWSVLFAFNKP